MSRANERKKKYIETIFKIAKTREAHEQASI